MNCPHCGSVDVRLSRREYWADTVQHFLGKAAFRCRSCRKRFFALKSSAGDLISRVQSSGHSKSSYTRARERRRMLRRIFAFVIFTIAFLLFWMFLQYTVSRPPSSQFAPVDATTTSA
jgi:hypothetical protein